MNKEMIERYQFLINEIFQNNKKLKDILLQFKCDCCKCDMSLHPRLENEINMQRKDILKHMAAIANEIPDK